MRKGRVPRAGEGPRTDRTMHICAHRTAIRAIRLTMAPHPRCAPGGSPRDTMRSAANADCSGIENSPVSARAGPRTSPRIATSGARAGGGIIGKTRRFDVTRIRRIAGITGFIPVIPGNRRDHPRDPGDPRHCRSDPSDPGPRP